MPLLNSRVPKGPLLNSRACLRILMVEHLKVLNSRAPDGPYGRAPKGPLLSLSLMVEYLKVLWSSPLSLLVECANAP
jgi:hypothetical protein